ncbi:MAG: single-stranded-DNA-specific exonuclease RecJ, partial [Clostridia bacterium]|nr:single-stranded-DNA-specific exonuclease RecJ [Clostridia bacterium]
MIRYRLRNTVRKPFDRPKDMPRALHALLVSRGIASAEEADRFLHPGIRDFNDPYGLSDMTEAVALLRECLAAGDSVCVYGDYDCDGVCASAIMADCLRKLGAANVEVYLPDRVAEGYGLNEDAVRAISERCRLLVTVDCGITAGKLIALATELGMKCIVTDHHRPEADIPLPACPVVNPHLNDYPNPLCGTGVAFKVAEALIGRDKAIEQYIDIAALATVADIVPLQGENRAIVKMGLEVIRKTPRIGIKALVDVAAVRYDNINARAIAFQLGPRLNAAGRLGNARPAHDLILCEDELEAAALAASLNEMNTKRREKTEEIQQECLQKMQDFDFCAHKIIILDDESWHSGLLGLAASDMVKRYHFPAILLTEQDGVLHGSCRSIPGIDIHDALTAVKEHLVRFGGHSQAAGVTLNKESLEAFKRDLEAYLAENISPECYIPDFEYDTELTFEDINDELTEAVSLFEPTGCENPEPVFRCKAEAVSPTTLSGGRHLKMTLMAEGQSFPMLYWGHGSEINSIPDRVDALLKLSFNVYQGKRSIQTVCEALQADNVLTQIQSKTADETPLRHDFLTELFYNRRITYNNYTVTSTSIDSVIDDMKADIRGTCVLCFDLDTAEKLARRMGDVHYEVCFGRFPTELTACNCLCVLPAAPVPSAY